MKPEDIVRKACVVAYNLDFDQFLKLFGMADHAGSREKWHQMGRDFSKWYCHLDSVNSRIFMEYVLREED